MKNSLRHRASSLAAIGCALAFAGCQQKETPADESASAARNTNSSSVVNAVGNAASNVVESASNAVGLVSDKVRTAVSQSSNVDNSGINVRDRNGATLTPGDQGNSPTDLALTQQIRKALVAGTNDFSVVAENVKIMTVNGKVTLRGPVNSQSEKDKIGLLAQTIAGDSNVENKIEVKATQ